MNMPKFWVTECTIDKNYNSLERCTVYSAEDIYADIMGSFEVFDYRHNLIKFVQNVGIENFGNLELDKDNMPVISHKAKSNYSIFRFEMANHVREFYAIALASYFGMYMWAMSFPDRAPEVFIGSIAAARARFNEFMEDLDIKIDTKDCAPDSDLFNIRSIIKNRNSEGITYGFNTFNAVISDKKDKYGVPLLRFLNAKKSKRLSEKLMGFVNKTDYVALLNKELASCCERAYKDSFNARGLEYKCKILPIYAYCERKAFSSNRKEILPIIEKIYKTSESDTKNVYLYDTYLKVDTCDKNFFNSNDSVMVKVNDITGTILDLGAGGAVLTIQGMPNSYARVNEWFNNTDVKHSIAADIRNDMISMFTDKYSYEGFSYIGEFDLDTRNGNLDTKSEFFSYQYKNGKPCIELQIKKGMYVIHANQTYIVVVGMN